MARVGPQRHKKKNCKLNLNYQKLISHDQIWLHGAHKDAFFVSNFINADNHRYGINIILPSLTKTIRKIIRYLTMADMI